MAVKLRLRREGTKKRPHYRVVAADARSPRNGRFIEIIGEYHPLDEPSTIKIESARALHWLQVGAQPTEQVQKLLRITGVWEEFKPGDKPARDRTEAKPKLSKKAKAKLEQEREDAADAAEAAKVAAEEAKVAAKEAKAAAKAAAAAPAPVEEAPAADAAAGDA
ncbi:MAG: small subunit ribosomal protein S16 [Glaciecola sp.]|jgi:small subunit ribosomal protein S16